MPATNFVKSSTPISTISSMVPNNTPTAVQSGPYTKAQFQSTMEGSRTVKSSKEVEQLLRDYPAALELYRTGKYKVKVKYEADVERVILVEKRTIKNPITITNDTQENNQTVPDLSTNNEQDKDIKKEQDSRQSRSRTHSQDRVAPTNTSNLVHTTISSIHMTSNTQPKVDHHRTPSKERETSVTPPQKQYNHRRSHSRDSQHKVSYNKQQQGKQINREYPKMMVHFGPNPGNLWQQQRPHQPYFSNPLLQQPQSQPQQQQRTNLYMPPTFVPQQNQLYRPPYYFGQRPAVPVVFQQQQPPYPALSTGTFGKSRLYSTNNFSLSSRSVSNTMGLPPSFRTFHSNQPQVLPVRPLYQSQLPFPANHPWSNMAKEPFPAMMNNNAHVEQQKNAKHGARSVDPGLPNNPPVYSSNIQQQPATGMEHYYHHHRHRPHPTNNVGPSVEHEKVQNVSSKEPTNVVNGEKLTVRQLNENFIQTDPSGRLPYSSLPAILQRFSIILTENDIISAAQDLEYNVNEPISARRLVHVLVRLGKITKSTQQQQHQPVSPSMLPEDREVTDIMTQRKATANHMPSSTQPNQWH